MLTGKVVLITGAGGLIGGAIAHGTTGARAQMVLVDIDASRLACVSDQLPAKNHISVVADASSPEGIQLAIDKAVDRFGKLDAAVHCAYPRSAGWGARFEDLKKSTWTAIYPSSLVGQYYVLKGCSNFSSCKDLGTWCT